MAEMAEQLITLEKFWTMREKFPMVDARSENEFAQSNIPGAINLPILNNQERITVGTLYKQQGPEKAILKGFELVGPRFHLIQKDALKKFPEKKIIIYCWRGGMRSQILSWILSMVGFEIFRLQGGYKTYRNFTFEEVRKQLNLLVLGGKTGAGKTWLLHKLKGIGEQILDLEGLAHHRGSSFGSIGLPPQPSVEQFENLLAEEIMKLDLKKPIWVENESRKIGRVILPDRLFEQMVNSHLLDIQKSNKERIKQIEEEYACLPKEDLIQAVKRLQKKLGGLRTQQAIEDIQQENHESWIENLLGYYDKTYDFDLDRHVKEKTFPVDLSQKSEQEQIEILLKIKNQLYGN